MEKISQMPDHVLVAHHHKNTELGPCEMDHCDPHVKMQIGGLEVGIEKQNDPFHDGIQQVKDMHQERLGYALV